MTRSRRSGLLGLVGAVACGATAEALVININPGPGLSGNALALAAFQAAADQWEARLNDPVTVNINADLAVLPSGVIGSASSTMLFGDTYAEVRDALVADAQKEVSLGQTEDTISTFLPTFGQLNVRLPAGVTVANSIRITKANVKALAVDTPSLGVTPGDLDTLFGASDAEITFSSAFSFDYDRSDGIGATLVDFQTAAAHEIGHSLGFISTVDELDGFTGSGSISLSLLDLYRFETAPSDVPGSATGFTTAFRTLRPGKAAAFSDTTNLWAFSTGVDDGDGRQASHWKDDSLSGTLLGMMDPTLANGQFFPLTEIDFRAFDLLGWNITVPVPEPQLLGLAGLMLGWRRRRVQ